MKNNILVVSENKESAQLIESKLVFLRCDDNVLAVKPKEACVNLRLTESKVVLIKAFGLETLDLIKELRQNGDLCIILVLDSYDSDFVLKAYDCGINDFLMIDADETEFVVRIVNNIKHNSVKILSMRNIQILKQLNVINKVTGIYQFEFAKQIFENFINENLIYKGIFMAIAPVYKSEFSIERFADAIRKSIRVNDLSAHGHGECFYLLLSDTDLNGALVVINKIKEFCGDNIELNAGIVDIDCDRFIKFEKDALKALADASATCNEYVYVEKEEGDSWLDESLGLEYKFFKKIFNRKMKSVILPVFETIKEQYENILFETKIELIVDELQCTFRLKNKILEGELSVCLSSSNLIFKTIYQGLNSPENKEQSFPLNKLKSEELVLILETFIKEFKSFDGE